MKHRWSSFLSVLLTLLSAACVDRINLDIGGPGAYPVVIDGLITDQPGPYYVEVSKAFDIESKLSLKEHISVKEIVLSDNYGTSEILQHVGEGFYGTSIDGIQGMIGRVYKLRISLLDGRVYESLPDTLLASGSVDKVYYAFRSEVNPDGLPQYGFDVYFDASAPKGNNNRYLWYFTGTYKTSIPCCLCWVDLHNPVPLTSYQQFFQDSQFKKIRVGYVPVTGYTFMYKVRAQVTQFSLTRQAFAFWKAVQAQANGNASLFQPVTGKIPSNFVQISGAPGLMQGLFYASSYATNAVYITRNDLPSLSIIPIVQIAPEMQVQQRGCTDFFPNSTAVQPYWWID